MLNESQKNKPPKMALFTKKVKPPNSSDSTKGLTLQVILLLKKNWPQINHISQMD
jgi:hypothetical protein